MTQAGQIAHFNGQAPPNLQCGFCKKPVRGVFYRTLGRFACAACAGQVQAVIDRNAPDSDALMRAGIVGLVVAIGCAAAWAAISVSTHSNFGIVASFIGYAVGRAVFKASGKRRGAAYQWLAVGLSIVGVAGGKVAELLWVISADLGGASMSASIRVLTRILSARPRAILNAFDLLWLGIAVFVAWRICKAPPITVAGPYACAADAPAATGLQFETVEHADGQSAAAGPEGI